MKNYFEKQMTGWIWPVGIVCRPYPAALGNNQSLLSQVVGPDLGPWTDICVSAEIMKACGQCFSFSVFDTLLAEKLCWNSVQFSSVTQLCPALCNPMNRSTPGLPVHHELPEFNQTHVHWVGDAIQTSHPLSSPSPPAPNPSQHQGLFRWVSLPHQVAKVLEFQLQHQSFQWTPKTDLL